MHAYVYKATLSANLDHQILWIGQCSIMDWKLSYFLVPSLFKTLVPLSKNKYLHLSKIIRSKEV